jgi:coxsackievirus/adenovirus receptor
VPYCAPCGECFDDWTTITDRVRDDLDKLEQKASNLAVASTSSTRNFSAEYAVLDQKLNDIKSIVAFNRTDRDVKELTEKINNIK